MLTKMFISDVMPCTISNQPTPLSIRGAKFDNLIWWYHTSSRKEFKEQTSIHGWCFARDKLAQVIECVVRVTRSNLSSNLRRTKRDMRYIYIFFACPYTFTIATLLMWPLSIQIVMTWFIINFLTASFDNIIKCILFWLYFETSNWPNITRK